MSHTRCPGAGGDLASWGIGESAHSAAEGTAGVPPADLGELIQRALPLLRSPVTRQSSDLYGPRGQSSRTAAQSARPGRTCAHPEGIGYLRKAVLVTPIHMTDPKDADPYRWVPYQRIQAGT